MESMHFLSIRKPIPYSKRGTQLSKHFSIYSIESMHFLSIRKPLLYS